MAYLNYMNDYNYSIDEEEKEHKTEKKR